MGIRKNQPSTWDSQNARSVLSQSGEEPRGVTYIIIMISKIPVVFLVISLAIIVTCSAENEKEVKEIQAVGENHDEVLVRNNREAGKKNKNDKKNKGRNKGGKKEKNSRGKARKTRKNNRK